MISSSSRSTTAPRKICGPIAGRRRAERTSSVAFPAGIVVAVVIRVAVPAGVAVAVPAGVAVAVPAGVAVAVPAGVAVAVPAGVACAAVAVRNGAVAAVAVRFSGQFRSWVGVSAAAIFRGWVARLWVAPGGWAVRDLAGDGRQISCRGSDVGCGGLHRFLRNGFRNSV